MLSVCKLTALFVLVLAAAPVYPQSVLSSTVRPAESDAFEELRSTLRPGTLVSVEDDRGRRRTGRFRDIADSRVYVESGSMPLTESFGFDEIVTIKAVDSRRNGFWTGFAVGAVPGLMFGGAVNLSATTKGRTIAQARSRYSLGSRVWPAAASGG